MSNKINQISGLVSELYAEGYTKGYADAIAKIRGLVSDEPSSIAAKFRSRPVPTRAPRGEAKAAISQYVLNHDGCTTAEIMAGLPKISNGTVQSWLSKKGNDKDSPIERKDGRWYYKLV